MTEPRSDSPPIRRRRFLSSASTGAMAGGLLGSYGTAAYFAGRFLYPPKPLERSWLFVATVDQIPRDGAILYRTPAGEVVTVARRRDGNAQETDGSSVSDGAPDAAEQFIALSSTCPHLGCRAHWEPQNERFFCPCHNGVFTREGIAVSGPPAEAGQSLPRFRLKLEGRLLFIEVPVEGLVASPRRAGEPAGLIATVVGSRSVRPHGTSRGRARGAGGSSPA